MREIIPGADDCEKMSGDDRTMGVTKWQTPVSKCSIIFLALYVIIKVKPGRVWLCSFWQNPYCSTTIAVMWSMVKTAALRLPRSSMKAFCVLPQKIKRLAVDLQDSRHTWPHTPNTHTHTFFTVKSTTLSFSVCVRLLCVTVSKGKHDKHRDTECVSASRSRSFLKHYRLLPCVHIPSIPRKPIVENCFQDRGPNHLMHGG